MGPGKRFRRSLVSLIGVVVSASVVASPGMADVATVEPSSRRPSDFIEHGRSVRAQAVRQAGGCEGLSSDDFAQCKAFRPREVDQSYSKDHVVARFLTKRDANREAELRGSRVVDEISPGSFLLELPDETNVPTFVGDLNDDPSVVYAEPDHEVQALQGQNEVVEWGVDAVKAQEAETTNGVTGDGVVVAVIDTGVDYTHPDLDDNIFINTLEDDGDGVFDPHGGGDNDGVDDDGNGLVDDVAGYDFSGRFFTSTEPDNDAMDVFGHGTHVAGIVAAEDGNAIGVRGVAPDAKVLPVRVLDDGGSGFDSAIAKGIRYATDMGADVMNISLGGYGRSTPLREAVDYARANGTLVVAAAGNSWFYSLPSFPAAFPGVLSVAAAPEDAPLTKVWWSDWGHSDFLAPGVDILSTTPDDQYESFSGTSMAAPHVAGAAALVHEKLSDEAVVPTPSKVEQALSASAVDVHFAGADEVSGAGVPDAEAATTFSAATDQVAMYRDDYLIPSDEDTAARVVLRVLEGDGDPIVGEAVAFTTDMGILQNASLVTDANGEATAELLVDDDFGVATVTADPANHDARTVRIIVEDDRIRVDDAHFLPNDQFGGEPFAGASSAPPSSSFGSGAFLQPGNEVVFRVWLGQHDFRFNADRVSSVVWEVGHGATPVPEMSGELDPVTVVPQFASFFSPTFDSEPIVIPPGLPSGRYQLSVTATMDETDETHTFEKEFFIGRRTAEILVVGQDFSFDVETFNFFGEHQTDSAVRRAIEDTDRSFTFWDPDVHGGSPPLGLMRAHPVVVLLGGWSGSLDLDAIGRYLALGGNLLVSGEQFATVARLSGSTRYRELLNARGLLTTFFPDDNHRQNPSTVTFAATGPPALDAIAGAVDLGPYDLNHTNESTGIFTDELVLVSNDGAETLATYASGINPAGGFEAATVLNDGTSRVANLGFGIESINDGATTLADVLDAFLAYFEPAPALTRVAPARVTNGAKRTVTLIGTNFQPAGQTSALLDARRVAVRVLSRTHAQITLPARFPPGTYDVKIVNPDGDSATKANALRVVRG